MSQESRTSLNTHDLISTMLSLSSALGGCKVLWVLLEIEPDDEWSLFGKRPFFCCTFRYTMIDKKATKSTTMMAAMT